MVAQRLVEEDRVAVFQELKVAWVVQKELEAEQDMLWAQLGQGMGCLELAPPSLWDVVIA